ncbi:lipase (class 2) [Tahibacter aquaticus]|uniref:Lipase (Class 2) n=1 Tax=Tahibacter aquaticus TaxID=520092 RepID=A0A4R6YTB1_9GAMM|nr:alpha/beta fold hydrolase [Tahibacter aquaticus]TDR41629.1 lipase (class 2) [Tahibacter aquaticus]
MHLLIRLAVAVALPLAAATSVQAACVDSVVLVHGNSGSPTDFDNTYVELRARGYTDAQIRLPDWGSKTCPACNDHSGTEETPVANALTAAIASSCTGKIDVIGHSMGVTLAAREILKLNLASKVDTFVGIAGGYRGLYSCGIYPYNVPTSTCGSNGLSIGSPLLNGIYNKKLATREYSIKSYVDEIVCSTGTCLVYGVHSSSIAGENASYTYPYYHYQLLWFTSVLQADLVD